VRQYIYEAVYPRRKTATVRIDRLTRTPPVDDWASVARGVWLQCPPEPPARHQKHAVAVEHYVHASLTTCCSGPRHCDHKTSWALSTPNRPSAIRSSTLTARMMQHEIADACNGTLETMPPHCLAKWPSRVQERDGNSGLSVAAAMRCGCSLIRRLRCSKVSRLRRSLRSTTPAY
jgi:hypothetical protein